jgi:pimeloyl-ACP methyl ester carboxylesterase
MAQSLPESFDYLGPEMRPFVNSAGRDLVYIDQGQKDWRTVLFFSGASTSAQAFHLTEFLATLRKELKLRVISLERNGFGDTEFLSGQGIQDHAANVKELLDHLGLEKFVGVAISGGGPFLEAAAALMPERVVSLHYAAAYSYAEARPLGSCLTLMKDKSQFVASLTSTIRQPKVWWNLGPDTSANRIPGFQDAANGEGARAFFVRGQMGDSAPAVHEMELLCQTPAPAQPSAIEAPLFMYYGEADKIVPSAHAEFWTRHYPKSPQTLRLYPGEGHDVQYRHWEQILIDMAGLGDKLIVCASDKSQLMDSGPAEKLLASGEASLGLCLWR